jgi:hypothetical protein
VSGQSFLVYIAEPLVARRYYQFRFSFSPGSAEGQAERPAGAPSIARATVVPGRTARRVYMSADAGVLYAGDISTAALYIGTNIYFRPVNKEATQSSFGRRFAVTLGMTVSSIEDEDHGTRTGLLANQALVLGAGCRLTRSFRAGAGAIVFKEADPNPLITRQSTATTWYVSFSFDLDVARGLAALGRAEP